MDEGIIISGLTKTFGDFSLRIDSLEIPKGYVTSVIGNNGAGKTTLLKCISGTYIPKTGTVRLFGSGRIGFVFDECPYYPGLRVRALDKQLGGIFGDWDRERFSSLCGKLGIDSGKRISELSRGTKMKLQFAVALSRDTDLLLLDEATSGMDPDIRRTVLDMVRDYISDGEHAVVISSHEISDLEKISDYILFLDKGEIILHDDIDSLREGYGILRSAEVPEPLRENLVYEEDGPYGKICLIRDREGAREAYPELLIDNAALEDIAVSLIRSRKEGET